MRSRLPLLALVAVFASGCFSPEEELGTDSQRAASTSAASSASTTASTASTGEPTPAPPMGAERCSVGAPLRDVDEVTARRMLQGRWVRCGEGTGAMHEASAFARTAAAFELVGDEYFALAQQPDGSWARVEGGTSSGTVSWWTTNQVGLTLHSNGLMDPALIELSSGGVRFNFYPGAQVVFLPLP